MAKCGTSIYNLLPEIKEIYDEKIAHCHYRLSEYGHKTF